jgi:rod shape-determining protein MreC
LKAGPSTSVVLLVTDAGSRVAVTGSRSRVQGILAGGGAGAPMELRFVSRNALLEKGEILVTSGMDAACPKGIPVARVTDMAAGAMFMQEIRAEALADFSSLEEVLLLQAPANRQAPEPWGVHTRGTPNVAAAPGNGTDLP